MIWTFQKRNQLIEGSGSEVTRCRVHFWHLSRALVAAGWTVKGSGTGSGGAGGWDNVDRLTGGAPTADLAWIGFQNADGVQLLLQASSNYLYMAKYAGSYVGTGANASTWPDRGAIPAAELLFNGGNQNGSPHGGSDWYLQVVTGDDGCSFWSWGRVSGGTVCTATALLKLTDYKVGDTDPYIAIRAGVSGQSMISTTNLNGTSYAPAQGRHPGGTDQTYMIGELWAGATAFMDVIGADPISGKMQLLETIAVCPWTSYQHIRGKVPGLLRCPANRAVGDTFNSGAYVCCGSYALPWGSGVIAMT